MTLPHRYRAQLAGLAVAVLVLCSWPLLRCSASAEGVVVASWDAGKPGKPGEPSKPSPPPDRPGRPDKANPWGA